MSWARFADGSEWEAVAGYSRAVRIGARIAVSGTTGHAGPGEELGDTYTQTRRALRRALDAVGQLGGSAGDVVRSRVYLTPSADWRAAARAHLEVLGDRAPANTMLHVPSLIGEGLEVEVELDAEVATDAIQPAAEQRPGA